MKFGKLNYVILISFCLMTQQAIAAGILRTPAGGGDDRLFTLTGVEVHVQVYEQVALTTVRNSFSITGDDSVNGTYHYRVPYNASVTGFGVWQDTTFNEFDLRPGEQGGPGGGVGDNDDLREFLGANPFSISVGDIPPGTFSLELSYAQLLPYDFGVLEMIYPLYSGDWLVSAIDTVAIYVIIESQRELEHLQVNGLEEFTEINFEDEHNAQITLIAKDIEPEDDWSFNIVLNQEDIGAWLYTHRSNFDSSGYFMLVIDPGIVDTAEQVQKNFTFVLDRSGSMRGEKLAQAKAAVSLTLGYLLPSDYFNVLAFSNRVDPFQDEMVEGSERNIANARSFINDLNANGATNIYDVLMTAISQEMEEGSANQVIFLTDGHPTAGFSVDPDVIVQDVTEANAEANNARIFSFGVGDNLNRQLLSSLSEQNHGTAVFIEPEEESIDEIIEEFYQYFASPTLINPVVEYDEELEIENVYPPELQDVSSGRQLYLFGRYSSFGTFPIMLSGTMVDGDTTFVFEEMEFAEDDSTNEFVPRMWAKSVIDYWLLWMDIHGEDDDIIQLIIDLSIHYGILTPYTEFEEPPVAVMEPVFSHISAEPVTGGVLLNWVVSGAVEHIRFNVYRSDSPNGEFVLITDIPLDISEYFDPDITAGQVVYYRIEIITADNRYWSELIMVGQLPTELVLLPASPNPFNDQTRFSYSLPRAGTVEIGLYNMLGQHIITLVQGEQSAGLHNQNINARYLATGSYFIRLEYNSRVLVQPVVLLK